MSKEKRDIPLPLKPVVLKIGAALAISLGGVLYTLIRFRRNNKPHKPKPSLGSRATSIGASDEIKDYDRSMQDSSIPKASSPSSMSDHSSSSRYSRDRNGFLLPEFDEIINECNVEISPRKNEKSSLSDVQFLRDCSCAEHTEYEGEIRSLRSKVEILQERERSLENKLLEYYGIKEQETAVLELQNRLTLNNMEAKLYSLKIESFRSENKKLAEQVADFAKVVTELEAAKTTINVLRKKLRCEAEQNREQILNLQERVMKLQEQDTKGGQNDQVMEMRLEKVKELEDELDEIKRSNKVLKLEKSELAQKLEYVQMFATSALDNQEVQELHKESEHLRAQNEDLTKQLDQLQADRCTDVEELVYLRWINACLRFELRNYKPGPGTTVARDLSKTLSPKSEDRAKQLILEYAKKEDSEDNVINMPDFDSSSQNSYLTDSGEPDDSSADTLPAHKSKPKLFSKLMRLLRGKDSHHQPARVLERAVSMDEIVGRTYFDSRHVKTSRNASVGSSRLSLDLQGNYSRGQKSTMAESSIRTGVDGSLSIFSTITEDDRNVINPNEDVRNAAKDELVKYADALKKARVRSSFTKRSASFSSF